MKRLTLELTLVASITLLVCLSASLSARAAQPTKDKDVKIVNPATPVAPMEDNTRPDLGKYDTERDIKAMRHTERRIDEITNHWYVGIGNVWSTALVGSPNQSSSGTKINLAVAYIDSISEYFSYIFFYDANLNTDAYGRSDINTFGGGIEYFFLDRLATTAPFARFDLGYGGSNRFEDGGPSFGLSVGGDLFRNSSIEFELLVRYQTIFTNNTTAPVAINPGLTQLRFGLIF